MRANGFATVITVLIVWILVTTTIYRFRHPELTETQLFLKLPQILTLRAP
jgi:hypothetical protein